MPYAVEMRLGVQVPMRDGVNLSADIYLPKAHGPFPTVLVRTPYSNNSGPAVMRAQALANNGYVCVLQDTRGRWDSGGDYYPLQGEGIDGYDTQEWIGRQPWSNGKIATSGGSYLGHTGNVFRKGHRIRLEVSSSNFPRFDRNPNTGSDFGHDSELRLARQTVYHEQMYPSHLVLPVIRSVL